MDMDMDMDINPLSPTPVESINIHFIQIHNNAIISNNMETVNLSHIGKIVKSEIINSIEKYSDPTYSFQSILKYNMGASSDNILGMFSGSSYKNDPNLFETLNYIPDEITFDKANSMIQTLNAIYIFLKNDNEY
jgi:hypothetical protein